MAKWDGTPSNEKELQFWRDAYIAMAQKMFTPDDHLKYKTRGKDVLTDRLYTAMDIADIMLDHYQTCCECMEDRQREEEEMEKPTPSKVG